uniref:Protein containing EURL domain n=1 Tax=Rhipicephalus zambeziensis TaxID=60191 RepID=A0A224Y9U9_9ACAR
MAAATGDSSHEGTPPLLATSQVPIINNKPPQAAGGIENASEDEDGTPREVAYLWESAEVHSGASRVDKEKKAPDNTSHASQPAERDHKRWEWKSLKELSTLNCEQLQQLCSQLSQLIKQRSTDLAPLLEEHHNLQEEIDARNVVIQQLLKLTCQQMELPRRPIQMSVIFPESNSDEEESDAALYN